MLIANDACEVAPRAVVAVPARHPGRWAAAAVVGLIGVLAVRSVAANPRFQWGVVGRYLFSSRILDGLWVTLGLTGVAMLLGVLLGTVIALMRVSPNPLLRRSAWLYVWFFRGTPVLVQLLFWNFVSALYPYLSLGIPGGPQLAHVNANLLITPFVAGALGLGLNEAAYMSEIVRGGVLSIDEGQLDAARALGMTHARTLRRIVLPLAMKVIIPPTGNEVISMLKTSSLVSVIAYTELLYSAQLIYASSYQEIPLLMVVCVWYLALTSVLSLAQHRLEARFNRGARRS